MYVCDLSEIMDGLPCKEGCYCPAPICLLYVNGSNNLVPIAIQLKKTPGPDNPIFLPSDNWFDWTLAKMYYRCADAQVCSYICSHICMCSPFPHACTCYWPWHSYNLHTVHSFAYCTLSVLYMAILMYSLA